MGFAPENSIELVIPLSIHMLLFHQFLERNKFLIPDTLISFTRVKDLHIVPVENINTSDNILYKHVSIN